MKLIENDLIGGNVVVLKNRLGFWSQWVQLIVVNIKAHWVKGQAEEGGNAIYELA